MGTGTSRGRRETPRTKKCMDCRQGVPQGDRKEASEPRGPLPPGDSPWFRLKKGTGLRLPFRTITRQQRRPYKVIRIATLR